MKLLHRRIQPVADQHGYDGDCIVNVALNSRFDLARAALQHVGGDLALVARVTYAQPKAHEIRAAMPDDVANTVVATVAATLFEAYRSGRQIDLVVRDQQLLGLEPVIIKYTAHGRATEVHIALWLDEPDGIAADIHSATVSIELFLVPEGAAILSCQRVDEPEPGIVQRACVLFFRIAETGDYAQVCHGHGILIKKTA